MKRIGTLLSLVLGAGMTTAIIIASCGGDSPAACTPGKGQCAAGIACTANIDCLAGLTCDSGTHACTQVFVCTGDSQCASPTPSGNAACTSADKCICLAGSCQERGCSTDAVCQGGKVCSAGRCADRPAATGLSCVVATPASVVRQQQTVQFAALAKNANGAIIAGQTASWASSNTAVAAIDAASGLATGGTTTGDTNITCTITGGSTTPSAAVVLKNYANLSGSTQARAIVVDAGSGVPVQGATVVFERGGAAVTAVTTADGVALATTSGTGALSLHVFHADFHYVSVIGGASTDLVLPLQRKPDLSKAGGFKGTFDLSQVANTSDSVELGIAGASLPGPFMDVDFMTFLGELLKSHVKVGNLYEGDINLASGLYAKLNDTPIKGDYKALGVPGLRHAWALGGKIPFDKLISVLTPVLGGGLTLDNLPLGQLIAQILPFFDKFKHYVKVDQNIVHGPRVVDTADINGNLLTTDLVPDFANATAFPTLNAPVNQALTLATAITIPTLPRYNNQWLDGVVLLASANAPGRGLVPLGVSAAVDAPKQGETPDGEVDVDPVTAGNQSTVTLKMAPLHDGLEGSKFLIAALAISVKFSTANLPNISAIVTPADRIDATTSLGISAFLGFPEGAAYTLASRTFTLGTAVAGATFYRADFKAADGNWLVYFAAPASGAAFTLPAVPAGFSQRDNGVCAGVDGGTAQACTALRVFSLYVKPTSGAAPTLDDLARTGGLSQLNNYVHAFSNVGCKPNGSCAP